MALSGNFLTSDSGQGGGNYYGRLIFEWWRDSWGRSGGAGYHNISYTLKSYGGSSGYWQYSYNNSMNVDGTGYSRGQTQVYGAGATTILSGSKTLWTDGAGNRSFGASAQAGIYTSAVNSSGSGSWALDNIPMYATIVGLSGSITDEATSVYLSYSNPTGSASTFNLYVRPLGSTGAFTEVLNYPNYPSGGNVYASVNWSALRSALGSAKQGQLIYRITNNVGNTDHGWSNENILTIVNANPTFTTATYKDSNAPTVAVTGNDQYLIQGLSTLEAKILSADKAVALKSATMNKYNMTIGSINSDETYSTSTITKNLGTLGINANANLTIRAIDSRTNYTDVVLPVNVLAYQAPQVTATAVRINNFETSTDFHIEATISRLTISGTDKNTVNTSSGVRYRYKKTTDVSWGSWINKTSSTTAGAVSVTDFNVPTALDRNYAWNIQVEVTDKLSTSTVDLLLSVGIPVFRIGLDGKVYNNEKELALKELVDARSPATQIQTMSLSADGGSTTNVNDVGLNARFAVSAGDFARSWAMIPLNYKSGTSIKLKIRVYSGSTITNNWSYYVGCQTPATTFASWNIASNSTISSVALTANTVKEIEITVPSTSLVAGNALYLALRPVSNTATITAISVHMEYTAKDS